MVILNMNGVCCLVSCLQLRLAFFLEEATFSDHKKFRSKGFVKKATRHYPIFLRSLIVQLNLRFRPLKSHLLRGFTITTSPRSIFYGLHSWLPVLLSFQFFSNGHLTTVRRALCSISFGVCFTRLHFETSC